MKWFLLILSVAASQEVYESVEGTILNTTTLYPTNKTIDVKRHYKNRTEAQEENIKIDVVNTNNKDNIKITSPKKEKVITWTVDANYTQPNDTQNQDTYDQSEHKASQATQAEAKDKENPVICSHSKDRKVEDSNGTDSMEQFSVKSPQNNSEGKKFKPSPHLGSFFDDENINLLKFSTPEPSVFTENKPANDFFGSKDYYMVHYKSPMDTYRDQLEAPYHYESSHLPTSNNWKQTLDSKPTVESFVKIPAGGLYKHSDPFRKKPSSDADDGDFGLSFNEDERLTENPVKKQPNPWKNLVQLMTAFLPVGLIISALTPNIITLHSTDNDPYPSRRRRYLIGRSFNTFIVMLFLVIFINLSRRWRRADDGPAGMPAVSERCRRRLLCELHAEENYSRDQQPGRPRKHCYKLHCEQPHSLRRLLRWLLAHRPPSPPAPPARNHGADILSYHHRSNDYT